MKKIFALILILVLLPIYVLASNGDVVGQIYSTDIMCCVNGSPISSYNIGGKTVILVEDLENKEKSESYGFEWQYDDSSRTLTAYSNGSEGFSSSQISRGTVGKVLGNVLETDIKVYINSKEIKGYNIGGRTAVCVEDLGNISGSVNEKYGYSDYMCNFKWDEEKREIYLNTFIENNYRHFFSYPDRKLKFTLSDNKLSAEFNQENPYYCELSSDYSESFRKDTYKISDIVMDGDIVGQMYFCRNRGVQLKLDDRAMYAKTKGLQKQMTFEEAKSYIKENYKIIDEREDWGGKVYLAEKDGKCHLVYALHRGGFLKTVTFEDFYTLLEFASEKSDENGDIWFRQYPFAGPHGTTSMQSPCQPSMYDLNNKYVEYMGRFLSHEESLNRTKYGTAKVTVGGREHEVEALIVDLGTFVQVDKMAEICGFSYEFQNGWFVLNSNGTKITGCDTSEVNQPHKNICIFNSKGIEFNGMEGITECYLYNNMAYIPVEFFENKNFDIIKK